MKKLITALLVSLLILSGCSSDNTKLSLTNEDDITLELGQVALSLDPDDYVTYDDSVNKDDIKVSLHYAALSKDDDGNVITTPMTKELETSDLNRITDYVLVIEYEDESYQQIIHIKDTTAPEITDYKDSYTITEGDDLPDIKADVKVEDLSDVTVDIDTSKVKTDEPGEYKVTITAADTSDNKTEKEVTVTVKEEETISIPSAGGSNSKPSSGSGSSTKPSGSGSSSSGSSSSGGSSSGGSTSDPNILCPGGKDPYKACDAFGAWSDNYPKYAYSYHESMSACQAAANSAPYNIGGKSVDSVACSPISKNGGSSYGSAYRLELIHGDPGEELWYSSSLGAWIK